MPSNSMHRVTCTRKDFLVSALATALAFLALPPRVFAENELELKFTDGRSQTTLPFEDYSGLVVLKAAVNGSEPVDFLLDSGFQETILNADRTAALGLTINAGTMVDAPGGAVELASAPNVTIELPGLELFESEMAAIPLAGVEPVPGRPIWGILGHSFFQRFVVTIDYAAKQLTVSEPTAWSPRGNDVALPLQFENHQAFVIAQIEQPSRKTVPAQLKLDTGSLDAIGLNGSFVWVMDLLVEDQERIPALGAAVGGATENWVIRLAAIQLGPFRFAHPVVGYSEDRSRIGDAGTLGAEILRRFTVTFDYSRAQLRLAPSPRLSEPFETEWSGIFPIAEGPDFRIKRVLSVAPGSPAEQAGVQAGDRLLRVENRNADELSIAELRRLWFGPERDQPVTVERQGKPIELVVHLRERI